jgi:hypothetical protein
MHQGGLAFHETLLLLKLLDSLLLESFERLTLYQCCRKWQCSPCTHRVNATQQTSV